MLTTISFDKFMSIDNGELTEAKGQFDINTFKTLSVREMKKYLINDCGIKLGGKGSSREAFFLNKSNLTSVKGPSCLKLTRLDAKYEAGIGQNREEATILNKFRGKHGCFPLLYYYDKNYVYIIVELGTPLSNAPKSFISEQFGPLKDTIEDFLDEFDFPSSLFDYKYFDWMKNIDNKFEFTDFVSSLTTLITGQDRTKLSKDEVDWYNEFMSAIKDSTDPITYSIYETINFASKKYSRNLMWIDFCQPANWAFVKRNGYFILIPIDWGYSEAVAKKYYWW